LKRIHILGLGNFPHIQDSVVKPWLKAFGHCKPVKVVLLLLVHLGKHFEVEFAAEHCVVVTEDSQCIEKDGLVCAVKRIQIECFRLNTWPKQVREGLLCRTHM
jgi:hypothetical protein